MMPNLSPGMRQYYAQNPNDNPFGGMNGGVANGLRTTSQYRMPQGHAYGFYGMAPGQGQGQGQGHAALGGLAYAQANTLRRPTYFQPTSRPMSLSGGLVPMPQPTKLAIKPTIKPAFGQPTQWPPYTTTGPASLPQPTKPTFAQPVQWPPYTTGTRNTAVKPIYDTAPTPLYLSRALR